jgi:hypothetical protein
MNKRAFSFINVELRERALLALLIACALMATSCTSKSMTSGASSKASSSSNQAGASGGSSGGGGSTGITASVNVSTSIVNRLMTRNVLATTLEDVFGPAATAITATMVSPISNDFLMGGPCDNNDVDCPDDIQEDTQAPMLPATVAGRESMVTRTCDLIVSTDAAIRYAAAQARDESLSQNFSDPTDADTTAPTTNDLQAAYELFYSGKVPDPTVISQLQTVSTQALVVAKAAGVTPDLDAWRFTLLTLCLAPDWQIP